MGLEQVLDAAGNSFTLSTVVTSVNFGSGAVPTHGSSDLLVTKHDLSGQLIWFTLIGGTNSEDGGGITLDSSGNIYVTGMFRGTVYCGPDTLVSSTDEILIVKLDTAGQIIWGRKAGSSVTGTEIGFGIEFSFFDNALVVTGKIVGSATFGSFTVTGYGGFIAKLDTNGNWIWAFPAGNSMYTFGQTSEIDASGNIYFNDNSSALMNLKKLNAAGTLIWARSSIGMGSASCLKLDNAGNLFVSGSYSSPITFGSITLPAPVTGNGAYLVKYDTTGTALWARNISSNGSTYSNSIALNLSGEIIVAGSFTTSFYTDTTTFFDMYLGQLEGYVLKYSSTGSLIWFKQVGTSQADILYAVNYYAGKVIIAGYVSGTANATFSPLNLSSGYGGLDILVAQFNDCNPPLTQVTPSTSINICEGDSIHLQSLTTSSNYAYQWMINGAPLPGATGTSLDIAGLAIYSGAYAVQISLNGCSYMSHYIPAIINPLPAVNIVTTNYGAACNNDSVRLSATNIPMHTYQWLKNNIVLPGATNASYMTHTTGYYSVKVTSPFGCIDTTSAGIISMGQFPVVSVSNDTTICQGSSIGVMASGATFYHWYPSNGISNIASATPTASPTATTTYSVVGTINSCTDTAYISIYVNPLPTPTITNNLNQLTCNGNYTSYQWYYNSNIIVNATGQQYMAAQNGNYQVIVTDTNGCTGTSNVLTVIINGQNEYTLPGNQLYIYPTPLQDYSTVFFSDIIENGTLEIYSVSGKLVRIQKISNDNKAIIARGDFCAGIYFIKIISGVSTFNGKFIVE